MNLGYKRSAVFSDLAFDHVHTVHKIHGQHVVRPATYECEDYCSILNNADDISIF